MLFATARPATRAVVPAARISAPAVGLAVHSVEQFPQALVEQRVHAAAASAAAPLRHDGRWSAAAAATAVVRRKAPPRRVEGDERARRLP